METSELPVHGSNRTSARIQTARSTPRPPKCRRLQTLLEVNRKDERRGRWANHLPFLNGVGRWTTIPNPLVWGPAPSAVLPTRLSHDQASPPAGSACANHT